MDQKNKQTKSENAGAGRNDEQNEAKNRSVHTGGPRWTDAQIDAITARNCNLLVAAAAGAGKTAVLVERIIRKIIDPTNPVDIDKMLIVTFTNAAATEMRERIGEAIAAELDKNPESEYIRRQMSLLGKASITTIHSFCRDVIKKNIQNIDLDPGFRVADDTECTLMRMETITELFEDQYEQEQDDFKALLESYGGNKNDQAIQDMVMSLYEFIQSSPWPDEWLDEQLRALDVQDGEDFARTPWGRVLTNSLKLEFAGLSQMMTQALDILKYATGLEKYIPVFQQELSGINQLAELINAMIQAFMGSEEMTNAINHPSGSCGEMIDAVIDPSGSSEKMTNAHSGSSEKMTEAILHHSESTEDLTNAILHHSGSSEEMTNAVIHPSVCSDVSWDKLYEALHSLEFKRLPRAGKDADKEKQKLVKELRDTVKDSIKKMKHKLVNAPSVEIIRDLRTLRPVMQCLANLVREFTRRYTEKKRNKAILDFNDLEHLCLQILSDSAGKGQCPSKAALEYRAYFDEIMVDEYQDSNMVQEIIIRMISRDRPDYPNVFMVGDVKQSIYRFRQAKPELFLEKYNTYSQEKGKAFRKILLYKNFRSRCSILDAVNFIFKQIMSVNAGELDYTDSEALNPGAEFAENGRADVTVGGPVEFHLIQTGGTISEDANQSSHMVEKDGNPSITREEGNNFSNMMKMGGNPFEPDEMDLNDDDNNRNDEEEEIPDNIQCEARMVALRILELMTPDAQGRTFQVYDKKKRTYRKVAFKDIVVLLRATKKWSDVFLEEFSKMGIPAFADTGTGFFKTIEIQIILSLLQIIDNPLQDIPLLAVLRSPMFAFTTNELAQLRLMNRKAMLFDCLKMLAQNDSTDQGSPLAQESTADQGKLLAQEYVDDQKMPFSKEHRIGKDQFLKQEYLVGRNKPLERTILADQNQLPKDHSAVQDQSSYQTASMKAANFLEKYSCWREKALHLSTDQLLWHLYQDTGYFGMVGAMPGGEQRQANLRILYDRARQFEQTSYKGLFNFIHFIDRLKSSRGDMGSAKILGENDNVVRIMSIHKSKGLEFPVVFLSGCGKRFNLMDMNKSVLLHHQLGFGPDVVDSALRLSRHSAPKLAIRERIRVETLSEEMRILYVALTRAREKLIITGSVRHVEKSVAKWLRVASVQDEKLPDMEMLKSTGYLDWIGPAVIRHNALQKKGNPLLDYAPLGSDYSGRRITDPSCWEIKIWEKKDVLVEKTPEIHEEMEFLEWLDSRQFSEPSDYFDEVKRRMEWHYAYGKVNKVPAKVTVTELKRRYESDLADVSRIPIHVPKLVKKPLFLEGEKGLTAAERGTVLHFVMQHLDLRNKDIQGQIDEMIQKDLLTRQQAQSVRIEKINHFVDSFLGQRMLKAKQVYREVPFHLEIPCHEVYLEMIEEAYRDETLLMQGMIDCYFEEPDGLVLVDYKTDIIPPGGIEAIMGRYRVQLDYYARALAILTQKKVKERYLYLFSIGELLEM